MSKMGMTTKYQGASTVSPNQFTWQDVKDNRTLNKHKKMHAFFMEETAFSIFCGYYGTIIAYFQQKNNLDFMRKEEFFVGTV